MSNIKKYIAEFIGTCVLVTCGCGTAMLVGCDSTSGCGYILTAVAFGLVIVAMAYSIGNISGCHINPAVSLAMLINKSIDSKTFIGYCCAQCLGSLTGTFILAAIFVFGNVKDKTVSYGANGLAGVNGNPVAGLVTEIVLTFIFLIAILGVTSPKAKHGSFGGLVIGLSLILVHILGIGLTGTSVNPARSLGPALMCAFTGDITHLSELWVFIVGPFIGAALAALTYKALENDTPRKK